MSTCCCWISWSTISKWQTINCRNKISVIAKAFFDEKGIRVETIKLNGSIELAPLIGLSDIIVDIVETGTTLKENGLVVLDKVADVSARLIVNKASYATKTSRIEQFINTVESCSGVIEMRIVTGEQFIKENE